MVSVKGYGGGGDVGVSVGTIGFKVIMILVVN